MPLPGRLTPIVAACLPACRVTLVVFVLSPGSPRALGQAEASCVAVMGVEVARARLDLHEVTGVSL